MEIFLCKKNISKILIFCMFFGFYSPFLVNNASSNSETEYNFLFKDNQDLIEDNNIVIKNYSDTRGYYGENFPGEFDENTDFFSDREIILDYNNFNNGKIYGFTLGEGKNKLSFYGISDLGDFVSKITGLEFSKNYTDYNKVFLDKNMLSVKINFENGKRLELIDLVGFSLVPDELSTFFGELTSEFSSVEGFDLQEFLPLLSQNLEFINYDYKLENNLVLGEIFSYDGEKYSFIDKGYENIELLENEIIVKNLTDTKLGDNFKDIFLDSSNFENKDFGFGKSLFYDYLNSSGEIYGITVGDLDGSNKIFFDNLSSNEELIDEINSVEFFKNYSDYNEIFLEKDFLTAKFNFKNGNYLKLVDFVYYDSISDEDFKQYIYNNSGSGKLSTDLYQATSEDIGDLDSLSSDKGEDIINYINNNNVCDIFKLEEDISYFGEDKLNTLKNNYHLPISADCQFEGNNIFDFIVNNTLINNIDFLPDFNLVEEDQKIILGKIFEISEISLDEENNNDDTSNEDNSSGDNANEENQDETEKSGYENNFESLDLSSKKGNNNLEDLSDLVIEEKFTYNVKLAEISDGNKGDLSGERKSDHALILPNLENINGKLIIENMTLSSNNPNDIILLDGIKNSQELLKNIESIEVLDGEGNYKTFLIKLKNGGYLELKNIINLTFLEDLSIDNGILEDEKLNNIILGLFGTTFFNLDNFKPNITDSKIKNINKNSFDLHLEYEGFLFSEINSSNLKIFFDEELNNSVGNISFEENIFYVDGLDNDTKYFYQIILENNYFEESFTGSVKTIKKINLNLENQEQINVSGEYFSLGDNFVDGEKLTLSGNILNISGVDDELSGNVKLSGDLLIEGGKWDGIFSSPKIVLEEEFSIDELPENIEKEKVNQIVKIGAENGVSLKSEKDNLFEVSFKIKNGVSGVTYKVFKSVDLLDWEYFTSCELGENLICNFTTDSFSYFATQDSSVAGSCGTSQGKKFNSTPKLNLCSIGKESGVSRNGNNYSWTCDGGNGREAKSCSADRKVSSSGGGGGAGRGSYYFGNSYQINNDKNISKKSIENIDYSHNNEKKSVNNSNKNTKKELTSNRIKNIILNSKTKNYNINGYKNKIRIPEFKDSKYEEKIILLSDSIIKLLEKLKLSNTKNKEFFKNYNYFLLGLKLTRELDERGKLISKYSIKNLQKILK